MAGQLSDFPALQYCTLSSKWSDECRDLTCIRDYSSMSPPGQAPYCKHTAFVDKWVPLAQQRECDFEYWCEWRVAQVPGIVVGSILAFFVFVYCLRRMASAALDTSMTESQAAVAMKIAIGQGGIDILTRFEALSS